MLACMCLGLHNYGHGRGTELAGGWKEPSRYANRAAAMNPFVGSCPFIGSAKSINANGAAAAAIVGPHQFYGAVAFCTVRTLPEC